MHPFIPLPRRGHSPHHLLQERVRGVRTLFRDADQTEFIIATIPTTLGVAESRRLLAALRSEGIPCRRLVVNQVGGSIWC